MSVIKNFYSFSAMGELVFFFTLDEKSGSVEVSWAWGALIFLNDLSILQFD